MVELVLSQKCVNAQNHMVELLVQIVCINLPQIILLYIITFTVVCSDSYCASGGTCSAGPTGVTCL